MASSCPICEQPIATTAPRCTVCGFPTALAIDGLLSVGPAEEGTGSAPPTASGPAAAGRPNVTTFAASPEEELATVISRDLRSRMVLLRDLGEGPDPTSELCHAALSEAEGRSAEALEILRSAQSRFDRELDRLLERRLSTLRDRRAHLERTGVRVNLDQEFERIGGNGSASDRGAGVTLLAQTERRLAQLESDWKGLQGLLAKIEGLRTEALELGIPIGEISSELDALREHLRERALTEESLDSFAQDAAQILMLLHEAIPSGLERELARHDEVLGRYPESHAASAAARRHAAAAARHLRKGRISEAVQSVRDLRREITTLERAAPPAPAGPEAANDSVTLERLLKKARTLAGRVRTLPPDSEIARDAAIQIREATDFLKERQLSEADLVLTRLMRLLATEAPPS